jgi:hypothetical protein
MKRTRVQVNARVVLLITVLGLTPALAAASTYLPLGDGVDHVYAGVPFEIWGVWLDSKHAEGEFTPLASADLSSHGTAKALHLIQYCAWADNVPDGVPAGHVTVYYEDGSTSSLDLIVGVNTAEWSYDNPGLEGYLQHTKVTPAYSSSAWDDTYGEYTGHLFYASIALDAKPLDRVELAIDPASYTDQETYGRAPADWFGVVINGLTIEYPPIPATLDINPDTLNLKSQGQWITAYLSLPALYDVAEIDPASLRLNDVVPAAWSWIDDETQVLMVKFAWSAVAEILEVGEAQITVTGVVGGDTKFAGTDVIRVIDPGAGPKKK